MFSSTARIINSKFCIKISYIKRITGLAIYFFIGYISLFTILFFVEGDKLNHTVAFLLTLIPSLIMGTGSAFGSGRTGWMDDRADTHDCGCDDL